MSYIKTRLKIEKSEIEWRACLTPEQYSIVRQRHTEPAFTSTLNYENRSGFYKCVACGTTLFRSQDKFDSGTGWPSYTKPIDDYAVTEHEDCSAFTCRTEVCCATCDAHLGHVFSDGPMPLGLRYCINGLALKFEKDEM
ncbi:MAG: Peptide methionine sulfoxide reductase MsrB [Hyphomicrobiaceae bacterium hypho_1]